MNDKVAFYQPSQSSPKSNYRWSTMAHHRNRYLLLLAFTLFICVQPTSKKQIGKKREFNRPTLGKVHESTVCQVHLPRVEWNIISRIQHRTLCREWFASRKKKYSRAQLRNFYCGEWQALNVIIAVLWGPRFLCACLHSPLRKMHKRVHAFILRFRSSLSQLANHSSLAIAETRPWKGFLFNKP